MQVLNAVVPTPEQIQTLIGSAQDKPIVMLNLLKFKERAAYDTPGEPEMSGREAYMRYAEEVQKLVAAGGGRMVHSGEAKTLVIGDVGEMWDAVAMVEYASPQAFAQMALGEEMRKIAHHRKAGLAGQLLIMCSSNLER